MVARFSSILTPQMGTPTILERWIPLKKGILLFILLVLLAAVIVPAMAETLPVSIPGLTLSVPADMLVYTREAANAYRLDRGNNGGWFDTYKDLYLYGLPYSNEYSLRVNIMEGMLIADFSKMNDKSLRSSANGVKTAIQLFWDEDITIDIWPEIQVIGKTPFIYMAYHSGTGKDFTATARYLTAENGMLYIFNAYVYTLPASDLVTAELEQILASAVFHPESLPGNNADDGGAKAP